MAGLSNVSVTFNSLNYILSIKISREDALLKQANQMKTTMLQFYAGSFRFKRLAS